jgi:hypothetical protein
VNSSSSIVTQSLHSAKIDIINLELEIYNNIPNNSIFIRRAYYKVVTGNNGNRTALYTLVDPAKPGEVNPHPARSTDSPSALLIPESDRRVLAFIYFP